MDNKELGGAIGFVVIILMPIFILFLLMMVFD